MWKRLALLLLLLGLGGMLCGCWDRTEIEDTAYVASIGVDAAGSEYLWTIRIVDPTQLSMGMLTAQPAREALTGGTIVVRATSLEQAVQLAQASVMRIISLEHVRWLSFGEEAARRGVSHVLGNFLRHNQMRRTVPIYVFRGQTLQGFIYNRPVGDVNPMKFFEDVRLVEKRMHLSAPISLQHFYSRLISHGVDPTTSVVGVNLDATHPLDEEPPPMDGRSLRAGEFPRRGGNPVEFAGMAIFHDDHLVGILDVDQTADLLALRGEMGKVYASSPVPGRPGEYITFRFHQENKPQFRAAFVNGRPTVKVKLQFEAEVLSKPETFDYTIPENRRTLEEFTARHWKTTVLDPMLQQIYHEWGADPVGFGQLFRTRFATYDDWLNYDWHGHLRDLTVETEVTLFIRRYGLLLGPALKK
ncbi:MAG: Ger(x)C family spore germination protein [Mycobacterium leprae]